jgi:hypothetical protein
MSDFVDQAQAAKRAPQHTARDADLSTLDFDIDCRVRNSL